MPLTTIRHAGSARVRYQAPARLASLAQGRPTNPCAAYLPVTPGAPGDGVPLLHRRLLDLDAITTDTAATLATKLSIVTFADLHLSLDDGRLARALPESTIANISAALESIAAEQRRLTLGRATDVLELVHAQLRRTCPQLTDMVAAGDVRRCEPLVASLVLVAKAADPVMAVEMICGAPWVEAVAFCSGRRALIVFQQMEIDIRVAGPDEYGTVLFLATGTREHIGAVLGPSGIRELSARETDAYTHAGLPWIPPELRHHTGEVEAARAGALPALVEAKDIRGDLHMHTTYSDGQDTLEGMVASCAALGYEYIAITDHSENSGASRSVTRELLERQRDEIERLRDKYERMAILHGIEVDILPSGKLDFPDDVLERLDIVLASLHDAARHDPATLTRRCLSAIRHPLVNVITHPTNQLVGRRSGYELDYPAIYAAAVETGTALEVDGAPSHLDLDGEHARAAVAAGVTLTIDSDCHRAKALARQMAFGVGTARRGWVGPDQVLNTRPLPAVREFVAAKRRR